MHNKKTYREFASTHQQGRCLLCPFPLSLGVHLHHVIWLVNGGPDHPLNIIALCPNHTSVLDHMRQHAGPAAEYRISDREKHIASASDFIQSLPDASRQIFDQLAAPFPLWQPFLDTEDTGLRKTIPRDIAIADAKLLLAVNRLRPSALLASRIANGRYRSPTTDAGYAEASQALTLTASGADVADVVARHLLLLDLSFDPAWLANVAI